MDFLEPLNLEKGGRSTRGDPPAPRTRRPGNHRPRSWVLSGHVALLAPLV